MIEAAPDASRTGSEGNECRTSHRLLEDHHGNARQAIDWVAMRREGLRGVRAPRAKRTRILDNHKESPSASMAKLRSKKSPVRSRIELEKIPRADNI